MPNQILHKRSSTPGAVPATAQLALGELALNTADSTWFLKKTDGTVIDIRKPAVADGSEIGSDHIYISAQNGAPLVATVNGDTLGLIPGFIYTVNAQGQPLATQNDDIIVAAGVV